MSGGKKTIETTSQKTDQTATQSPYAPAIPRLNSALTQADQLFKAGGPKVYTGDRVANLTPDQLASHGQQRAIAGQLAGQAPNPGINALTGMINGGGLTSRQNTTLDALMPVATGDPLNPYLRDLINDQAGELTDQLNRQFAGAGRLGSYSNANAVGDAVGDYMRGALFQGYDVGMGHKLAAADRVMSGDQMGTSNVLSASQMLPNLQAADTNAKLLGANLLGGVGQQIQTQRQNELDARIATFNERQNRPYDNLQRYLGQVGNVAQLGGTSTSKGTMDGTTTTEQQTPGWQTALGLGLSAASLFAGMPPGSMGSMGSLFGSGAPAPPSTPMPQFPQLSYVPPTYGGYSNQGFRAGF